MQTERALQYRLLLYFEWSKYVIFFPYAPERSVGFVTIQLLHLTLFCAMAYRATTFAIFVCFHVIYGRSDDHGFSTPGLVVRSCGRQDRPLTICYACRPANITSSTSYFQWKGSQTLNTNTDSQFMWQHGYYNLMNKVISKRRRICLYYPLCSVQQSPVPLNTFRVGVTSNLLN